jgi:hypothetical protein
MGLRRAGSVDSAIEIILDIEQLAYEAASPRRREPIEQTV